MAEIMRSVKIMLPENYWRGIIEYGLPKGEDLNEAMETIFQCFCFKEYTSIISDYKNGLVQATLAYYEPLEPKEITLSKSFAVNIAKKLSLDAPELTIGQALSYLLIKLLEEGLARISNRHNEIDG